MGVPVVAAFHAHDLGAACQAFGQFERSIHSFSARVHEVHAVQVRRQGIPEAGGCLALHVLDELAVHHGVQIELQLRVERIGDGRMAVAKVGHANPTDAVEHFSTSFQVYPWPSGTLDFKPERVEGRRRQSLAQEGIVCVVHGV